MSRIFLRVGMGIFSGFTITCGVLAETNDPLRIPDNDNNVPGAGPLRRTDWFRGVWKSRRSSWLNATESSQGAIVFLGDSITQGWGDDFQGFFGDLKVVNRGISGDTSRGLLLRLPGDVLALNPKAVVIMVGANDLAEKANGETVFNNVKLIVDRLKKHDKSVHIIVCETFPCAPDDYRPVGEIRRINTLYAKTWDKDSRVTLAKTYRLFAGSDGASLPKLLPDRVHPNIRGYAVWAKTMHSVFRELGLSSGTTYPHAWIKFSREDKDAELLDGRHARPFEGSKPVELQLEVVLEPGHSLAIQFLPQKGLSHALTIELNGIQLSRTYSATGDGQQSPFWDLIPVSEFGITERARKRSCLVRLSCPAGANKGSVVSGLRLISDQSQLQIENLPRLSHKVTR